MRHPSAGVLGGARRCAGASTRGAFSRTPAAVSTHDFHRSVDAAPPDHAVLRRSEDHESGSIPRGEYMDELVSRRSMLRTFGMAVGAVAANVALPCHAAGAPAGAGSIPVADAAPSREAGRPWYELGMMGDPISDSQLIYLLGAAWDGMTDVGECLDTARRIESADVGSWTREWSGTAERVRAVAEASAARGHRVSAGEAYLRSSTYYHGALLRHPEPRDPSVLDAARRGRACFEKALELLSVPAHPVRIPYERATLPGYFFRSPAARGRAPVLVIFQGRDAWPEDNRYLWDGAIRRGYHCLVFHGPGQGMALREQGLTFRPDWERVVSPAIDFVVKQAQVDPHRIVIMGLSMGGALAPRAAAFDGRIHTCIANPGVYSWADAMFANLDALAPGLVPLLETDPSAFDARVAQMIASEPLYRWAFIDWMWKHGASSPSELLLKMREFTNGPIIDRISCRMLVMDGTAEAFSTGQAKKLYQALRCPKEYMLFTEEDTGLLHCQTGAHAVAAQRMFDWLDEHVRA
jgi:alpha-beta hydrolase superfamily lysophospholipase